MTEAGTRSYRLAEADRLRSTLVRSLALGGVEGDSAARRRRRADKAGTPSDGALIDLYLGLVDDLVPAFLFTSRSVFQRSDLAFVARDIECRYRVLRAISEQAELNRDRFLGFSVLTIADLGIRAAAMVQLLRKPRSASARCSRFRAYGFPKRWRTRNAFGDWVRVRAERSDRDRSLLSRKICDRTFAHNAPPVLRSDSVEHLARWLAGKKAARPEVHRLALEMRIVLAAAHLEHALHTSVDEETRHEWTRTFLTTYHLMRRALRGAEHADTVRAFFLGLPALQIASLRQRVQAVAQPRDVPDKLAGVLFFALAEHHAASSVVSQSLRDSGMPQVEVDDLHLAKAAHAAIKLGALPLAQWLLDGVTDASRRARPVVAARARLMLEAGREHVAVGLLERLFDVYPGDAQVASAYKQALTAVGETRRAAVVAREMRRHGLSADEPRLDRPRRS